MPLQDKEEFACGKNHPEPGDPPIPPFERGGQGGYGRMAYRPPRLTDYGDFRRLTGGRTGTARSDGHGTIRTKNTS